MEQTTNTPVKGTGLQRKTKTQLIDIILRKDDVHNELNEKIKILNLEIDEARFINKQLEVKIDDQNKELIEEINFVDKITSERDKLLKYATKQLVTIMVLLILSIVEFLMIIL